MNSFRIAVLAVLFSSVTFAQAPTVGGCPAFPANNVWNARIDALPVDAHSADYINSISATGGLRYDTDIPITIVPGTQPKVAINITYADESDPGPFPIPPNALIESGGDRHVIVVDKDNCMLYELYNSYLQPDGSWTVDSSAKWSLLANALRPATWTSADAAGLPIMPGLLRYDEVIAGQVNHAIRFTAPHTQRLFIWPARHYASSNTSPLLPPMGQRFRLKAGFDISSYAPHVQTILRAMKTYGLMLADNGLAWEMQFAGDSRWNTSELDILRTIAGSNFEAVDESGLMLNPDSAQAAQTGAPAVTVTPGSVNLSASHTQQFTATVTGSSLGVIWTLSPQVGSVSATGLYTAPAVVSVAQNVTVTATLADGSAHGSAVVALQTAPPASLAAIAVSPSSVVGGNNLSVTVTLTGAAPSSGAAIQLTGSNAAFPAALVTVPAGQVFQTFSLPTSAVAAVTTVTISGAYNGASATSPALTVNPATYSTFAPVYVNAGGAAYTDSQGQPWRADYGFTGGSVYATPATIQNTSAQPVYQTTRFGNFQYQFIAPNGSYNVTLKFAEPYFSTAGSRRFNVTINGTAVLTNFDVVAQAGGSNRAIDRTFPVTVANGAVTIVFTGAVDYALVSGIQIVPGTAPPPPTSFSPIFVHAGGGAYTDSQGQVWSADTGFSGGSTWGTGAPILNTATPALYQTVRFGNFQYQFAVPNGSYTVTLKFAEVYYQATGSRVFNVGINGTQVLTNFDIVAQAHAAFTALDKTFPVTVANGSITIAFTSVVDWAMVNAVQITQSTGTPPPSGGFTPVMVHAGGGAYTDPQGQLWNADAGFSGGSTWATSAAIGNTATQPLYQTLRFGNFQYQFAAPNGSYTVTLKFAEIYYSAAGRRVFNVAINGTPVLTNFDIVAQAGGAFTALDRSFPVTVTNGQITIQFTSVTDWAQVNAIKITNP